MKKLIALVLTLALAGSLVCAGTAEETEADEAVSRTLSTSYFEENKDFFRMEVSEDGETTYIQTIAEAENRAFSTPYENDRYYSIVFPELMITNGSEDAEQSSLFRIWIRYRGTKSLNISAVSFVIDGGDYRFMDVTTADWSATKEDGTEAQDAVIILGSDPINATCFAGLFAKAIEYAQNHMNDPDTPVPDVTMILHGDEEVEVLLPVDFWTETAMFAYSLESIEGFSYLTSTTGTPCIFSQQ